MTFFNIKVCPKKCNKLSFSVVDKTRNIFDPKLINFLQKETKISDSTAFTFKAVSLRKWHIYLAFKEDPICHGLKMDFNFF